LSCADRSGTICGVEPLGDRFAVSTKELDTIRQDALSLSLGERAELARDLMASLDGPADPDAQSLWDREICRRINKLRAGEATLLDPKEVLSRIRKRLNRV
jgi:putative addiction module component (TIGR02574 family)